MTKKRLTEFSSHPSSAVLISGPPGSGKTAVGLLLAARLLGVDSARLPIHPYFVHIQKPQDKQEISIDAIRQVIKEMGLKPAAAGQSPAKRVVLIDQAGTLSEEAQNALLKILEEPGMDTCFILTAESNTRVLPTVASRTQRLIIAPVDSKDAISFFAKSYPAGSVDSAWQLSQGAAGLLKALLEDSSGHPLKLAVDEAKNFLKKDRYGRTLYMDSLVSDKKQLMEFLNALSRVLTAVNASAVKAGRKPQVQKLTAARRQLNSAIESLNRNASPRLIGLDLALSLPL